MKTKEEIEQLAVSKYGTEIGSIRGGNPYDLEADRKNGYIKGYTQCQEDIVKELTEWIEVTLSAKSKLGASDSVIETLLNVKYKVNSLNKQD